MFMFCCFQIQSRVPKSEQQKKKKKRAKTIVKSPILLQAKWGFSIQRVRQKEKQVSQDFYPFGCQTIPEPCLLASVLSDAL